MGIISNYHKIYISNVSKVPSWKLSEVTISSNLVFEDIHLSHCMHEHIK